MAVDRDGCRRAFNVTETEKCRSQAHEEEDI